MNPKQEAFCQEYIVDLNATQAAIRVGYSGRTAQEQSSRLLSNVMVQGRIAELIEVRTKRTQIDADWVLQAQKEVYDVAMGIKPTKVLVRASNDDGVSEQFVKEFEKHDLAAANKALETIGKHVDVQAWKGNQADVQINNLPVSVNVEFV